jgi:hypothetical protein
MNFETYCEKVYFNCHVAEFILLVSEIDHFSIVINTSPLLGGFGILPEIGCLSFLSAYLIITRYLIKWY